MVSLKLVPFKDHRQASTEFRKIGAKTILAWSTEYYPILMTQSTQIIYSEANHVVPTPKPFGSAVDVLFQIIINGDMNMLPTFCLLNKATYNSIKVLESHICGWFMRLHRIAHFDRILRLDPWTIRPRPLTVHTLLRFAHRRDIAQQLSRCIVPAVWGPFSQDEEVEMNLEAELRIAQRLERGLYVLFHISDIGREMETSKQRGRKPLAPVSTGRISALTKMLDEYNELPEQKQRSTSFEHYASHAYTVLKWGSNEADVGRKRLEFRRHLDKEREVDFHITLRMLRELIERMLLRHGPTDWHRDAKNEYSVISWFLLRQSPRTLEKLFLSNPDQCCDWEDKMGIENGVRVCYFSDPLDNYWKAWKEDPNLGCQDCDCKRRARSWSVKPVLVDARGRGYNRDAERYLKEMWGQRHVGLHRAFMIGQFTTVL